MPMRLPAKVSISPKAMSTLWWISPSGGQMNPASNNRPPNTHRLTDNINCAVFIDLFNIYLPLISRIAMDSYLPKLSKIIQNFQGLYIITKIRHL